MDEAKNSEQKSQQRFKRVSSVRFKTYDEARAVADKTFQDRGGVPVKPGWELASEEFRIRIKRRYNGQTKECFDVIVYDKIT